MYPSPKTFWRYVTASRMSPNSAGHSTPGPAKVVENSDQTRAASLFSGDIKGPPSHPFVLRRMAHPSQRSIRVPHEVNPCHNQITLGVLAVPARARVLDAPPA